MNYADLTTEAEMQDSKQWLAEMLSAVAAVRDMRRAEAEVTCLAQGWRQMRCGVSVIETPLCLDGQTYPLTPFSRDDRHWIAWQFHRADLGEGVIQAFRRSECPATVMCFPLRGLDPQAGYVVTDMDQPDKPVTVNGRALLEEGLRVAIQVVSQAVVIVYRRSNR
jgi:hypothetical protein